MIQPGAAVHEHQRVALAEERRRNSRQIATFRLGAVLAVLGLQ